MTGDTIQSEEGHVNVDGTLRSDTVVTRSEEPVAVEVDRSVVMMSVEQGMYFGLEGAGPRIWALLEAPRSVRQLCDALIQDFAVDPEVCRREVGTFLEELRRAQLVRFDVPPTDSVRPAPGA